MPKNNSRQLRSATASESTGSNQLSGDDLLDRRPSDESIPQQDSATSPSLLHGKGSRRTRLNGSRMPNSTPNSSSMSLQSIELERLAQSFLYRQAKVSRSQTRVLELRDRLSFDRAEFKNNRRWLHESQRALMEAMDRAAHFPGVIVTQKPSLKELYEQAHLDRFVLEACAEKLHELEDRFGALENILQKRYEKLDTVTRQIVELLQGRFSVTGSNPPRSDSMSDTSDSVMIDDAQSDGMNPVLADYYDKAGHLKNMRERLANVQMEYEEAYTQRNLEQDQEIPQALDDDEFQFHWDSDLAAARAELVDAEKGCEDAKAACISSGFTPYIGRKPPSEPDVDASITAPPTETPMRPTLIVDWEMSPHTPVNEQGLHFSGSPLALMSNPPRPARHNRVQSWIADMDTEVLQFLQNRSPTHERRPSTGGADGTSVKINIREDAVERKKMQLYLNDVANRACERNPLRTIASIPPRPVSDSHLYTNPLFKMQREYTSSTCI